MAAEEPNRVLITGCTGYVGSWCVKVFCESENFIVRGTTRNVEGKRAIELKQKFPQLELVCCELLKDEGWEKAFQDVTHLAHTASPFSGKKMDFVTPAVEGTKRVLNFAKQAGVTRIVVTSSITAIQYGHPTSYVKGHMFTTEDWTNLDASLSPYVESKTRAEREVEKFANDNKDIRVCTVNPGWIVGRPILTGGSGGSAEAIETFAKGNPAPRVYMPAVHCCDVATLHLRALELSNKNERIIAVAKCETILDYAQTIAEFYNKFGYTFTDSNLPSCILCCLSYCCLPMCKICCCSCPCVDPIAQGLTMIESIDVDFTYDNRRGTELLGNKWMDIDEGLIGLTAGVIEGGKVKTTEKYKEYLESNETVTE